MVLEVLESRSISVITISCKLHMHSFCLSHVAIWKESFQSALKTFKVKVSVTRSLASQAKQSTLSSSFTVSLRVILQSFESRNAKCSPGEVSSGRG